MPKTNPQAADKVRPSEAPFVPKGEPKNLDTRGISESPGKQLGSFARGLPAKKSSTITGTGAAGTEQSKTPKVRAPNKP